MMREENIFLIVFFPYFTQAALIVYFLCSPLAISFALSGIIEFRKKGKNDNFELMETGLKMYKPAGDLSLV